MAGQMTAGKRWLFRLAAVGFALILSEALLSLACLASPRLRYYLSPPWDRVLIDDPKLHYRMSPYYPGNDDWGYRNRQVPESCELLTIGDSMTYGFSATPETTWPRQLETLSGKSTYNISCGGYGPCEYQLLFEKGLELKPHTVLVGLTVYNDMADAVLSSYADGRFPEWQSSDEETRQELERDLADVRKLRLTLDRRPGTEENGSWSPKKWLSKHSALYGLGRAALDTFGKKQYYALTREDNSPEDAFEVAVKRPLRVGFDAGPTARTVLFESEVCAMYMDLDRPWIREGKRITEAVLLAIRDRLRSQGGRLIVVLLPSKNMVYRDLVKQTDTALAERLRAGNQHEERLTRELEKFLQDNQIDYVNTEPALRASLARGERIYPESDDGHPIPRGYQVLAEAILPMINKDAR